MTLGEKIAEARRKMDLSQEQLAEKLTVSRSAVAKWESDKGLPDIENIKNLSRLFGVSMDYLLGNQEYEDGAADIGNDNAKQEMLSDEILKKYEQRLSPYINKNCYIDLSGWNDGVDNSDIIGWDKDFIYYLRSEKKKNIIGAIAIKLIREIKVTCKETSDLSAYKDIDRAFFVDKRVNVNLEEKSFFSGMFGEDTEIFECTVIGFSQEELTLVKEGSIADVIIPIEKISKIEIVD